jgi:hypothetical protein
VTEGAPDKETQGDPQPMPVKLASRGVTATVACLGALVVIAAATANFLPSLDGLSLPKFDSIAFPKLDHLSFQSFLPAPKSERVAAQPPQKAVTLPIPERKTVSVPMTDPAVNAALRDIQSSQQQSAVVLASLTQSSATQGADIKRISRQLNTLMDQVDALKPLTTSSIPHVTPHVNPRARIIRTSRRMEKPEKVEPLPPPVGPVSVGGAPLSPAPTPVTASAAK